MTASDADKLLATWAMAGCNNEVEIARLGVRRAQSVEVKEFAQQMLDEHTQLAGKLLPFAGADAKTAKAVGATDKSVVDAASEREVVTAKDATRVAKGGIDHYALIADLSKRCLESQVKMLTAKSDADFDAGFMQEQVGLHTQAVIMVEVFGKHASPELRPVLERAGKSLRAHLEMATALCKKCDSGAKVGMSPSKQK